MKIKILTLAVLVALSGCGTFGDKDKPQSADNTAGLVNPGTQTALSEQRASEDFKREGIKIIYSKWGKSLEAVEVIGYAPVWGNSASAIESAYKVAELDAKRKLNDFINREQISTVTSVNIISKNLEKAIDNKNNAIANNVPDQVITTSDTEVEAQAKTGQPEEKNVNRAIRQDALEISQTLNQTVRQSSKGVLGGLRMVNSEVVNGGRNVKVTLLWEKANEKAIIDIRRSMMK